MKKTLLLCFIHGFQGGETTFGENYEFTEHLRSLVAQQLPKLNVKVLVYPKYETRGDLGESVSRFRDWLLEKVIDLEVAAGTHSPTVDPSVHTVLIGHSMGGIVAAETVVGLTSEKPIYSEDGVEKASSPSLSSLMFPFVQGVLAFDTPFLGIAPGVVAHGAEGHYQNAAAAYNAISGLWGGGAAAKATAGAAAKVPPALPAPPTAATAAAGGWQWGRIAMYAGAGAAAAAAAGAAYYNREQIQAGMGWASSHLEFVGCLARPEELRKRVAYVARAQAELGLGFANLYTRLGAGAAPRPDAAASVVGSVLGRDRTFCNLPRNLPAGTWRPAVNDAATDETVAHMSMFEPKQNPGYETLSNDARDFIVEWVKGEWYESSDRPAIQESAEDLI